MSSSIVRDFAPKFWETIHTDGAAVLPADPPWCHVSGANPYRVLLVGGTAAMGFGTGTHDLSIGGRLASVLGTSTGCGAEVDIVATPGITVESAVDQVCGRELHRYAAVVIVVDAAVAAAAPAQIAAGVSRLLDGTMPDPSSALPLIVAVAPQLPAELCGTRERPPRPQRMNAVAEALDRIGRSAPRGRGMLLAEPMSAEPAAMYEEWGRAIAFALVPRLPRWDAEHARSETVDVARRERAVERLGVLDGSFAEEFRRIVDYARLAFETRSAALSVFTGGETWFMTRRGLDLTRLPESETLCLDSSLEPGGLIVGDAREDRRFGDRAVVRGGGVAFYAGYRIESPDGQPIGNLCVFDPQPRAVHPDQLARLRDFAHAVQRRLWDLHVRRSVAR